MPGDLAATHQVSEDLVDLISREEEWIWKNKEKKGEEKRWYEKEHLLNERRTDRYQDKDLKDAEMS